ncbi:MAG: DUF192 domain-containing protein [Verrucomicrobiae bacterium]|nr:DUF192 domain-containing protein [Verrucomicrobiae bacterium]
MSIQVCPEKIKLRSKIDLPMGIDHSGCMYYCGVIVGVMILMTLAGCDKNAPDTRGTPKGSATPPLGHLNRALPRLETVKLWLGNQEITAEVARTESEIRTGYMFRTNIADGEGMLFVFGRPIRAAFYMRNTTIPLSCAYIDPEGVILEIHDLKPLDETPVEASSDNVQFVLEVPQGWFERAQVRPGTVVRTQYGALKELNWATLRPVTRR